ncbi:hypothetical protein ACFL60_09245 [Candidatus Omnitrophota bacterium]
MRTYIHGERRYGVEILHVSVVRIGFCIPVQEEGMRHKGYGNNAFRFVADGMLEFSDPANGIYLKNY